MADRFRSPFLKNLCLAKDKMPDGPAGDPLREVLAGVLGEHGGESVRTGLEDLERGVDRLARVESARAPADVDSIDTISTPASSSRPASAAIAGTVASISSSRAARRPPSRSGGSRVHTTPDAFATSIPQARSYRS